MSKQKERGSMVIDDQDRMAAKIYIRKLKRENLRHEMNSRFGQRIGGLMFALLLLLPGNVRDNLTGSRSFTPLAVEMTHHDTEEVRQRSGQINRLPGKMDSPLLPQLLRLLSEVPPTSVFVATDLMASNPNPIINGNDLKQYLIRNFHSFPSVAPATDLKILVSPFEEYLTRNIHSFGENVASRYSFDGYWTTVMYYAAQTFKHPDHNDGFLLSVRSSQSAFAHAEYQNDENPLSGEHINNYTYSGLYLEDIFSSAISSLSDPEFVGQAIAESIAEQPGVWFVGSLTAIVAISKAFAKSFLNGSHAKTVSQFADLVKAIEDCLKLDDYPADILVGCIEGKLDRDVPLVLLYNTLAYLETIKLVKHNETNDTYYVSMI